MKTRKFSKAFWVLTGSMALASLMVIVGFKVGGSFGSGNPYDRSAPSLRAHSAVPSAPADANVLEADDMLQNFPKVAQARLSEGSKVTVTGKVFAVRKNGKDEPPATWIELVGKNQSQDSIAHFTCQVDPAAQGPLPWIGSIVTITGTVDNVVESASRIDLLHSTFDIVERKEPFTAQTLIGTWEGELAMTPAALQKWARIATWQINPTNQMTVTPMRLGITFRANGTLDEHIYDPAQSYGHLAGTWSLSDDTSTLKMKLDGADTVESSIEWTDQKLIKVKTVAGLAALDIHPAVVFSKVYGTRVAPDFKLLKQQTEAWIGRNLTPDGDRQTLADAMSYIDSCSETGRWFSMIFDGGLTHTGKAIELCGIDGSLDSFELSDAQSRSSGVAANGTKFSKTRIYLDARVPEVKIESLEIKGDRVLSLTHSLQGKITVRLVSLVPDARCGLVMESQHGCENWSFDLPITLDSQTFAFSMPKVGGTKRTGSTEDLYAQPDPLPVFFSVCRMDGNLPSGLPDAHLEPPRVSDSIGMLLSLQP